MGFKSIALAVTALTLSTSVHSALVEYTYQGNMFTTVTDASLPAGETFTSTDSLRGSFVVSDLGANYLGGSVANLSSFSFSAGAMSITSTDLIIDNVNINVTTDINGDISSWAVNIRAFDNAWATNTLGGQLRRIEFGNGFDSVIFQGCIRLTRSGECSSVGGDLDTAIDRGIVETSGSWTAQPFSAVPVPATVWLFGSGLLGLIGMARRKKLSIN